MVIDTPGMRELQLWGVEEGVENTFADIRDLGTKCRFSNCGHTSEPGCAVQAALNEGTLDRTRYEAYCKLKDEQSKSKPAERKPSALAGKPGWRNRLDGSRPFRHREHSDD
jgi:ribosome biogenesis GTPase